MSRYVPFSHQARAELLERISIAPTFRTAAYTVIARAHIIRSYSILCAQGKCVRADNICPYLHTIHAIGYNTYLGTELILAN